MNDVADLNPGAEATRERPLAGTLRRALAFLIDAIVLWFGGKLLFVVIGFIGLRMRGYDGDLLTFLFAIVYFTYFDSERKAGSIGKQTMGMQVVNERDEQLSLQHSAKRATLKMLFNLLPLLWLAPLFTKYRQGVHDVIARTFVVDN